MSTRTVADVLLARLSELGVGRIFGPANDLDPSTAAAHGIDLVEVPDADLAVLLADADGRIGRPDGTGRLGAALVGGPVLHLSSCPGGTAVVQTVGSAEDIVDALAVPVGIDLPGTSALHLDLDLGAPVVGDVVPAVDVDRVPVMVLDPSLGDLRLVVVVGPGVVRSGALDGLRHLARTAGLGIVNTWGAKGVERWDSPFHFGTAGLQARDMELAGVVGADVVLASGLDPAEVPVAGLGNPVVQEVAPAQLASLCQRWSAAPAPTVRPALYTDLAAVVGPLYESDSVPLSPARAALHLSGALGDGGVAVADPGPAGLWLARAFPTSFPGSVCVPATVLPGVTAAAALVCALERRECLAVTGPGAPGWGGVDEPDPTTAALLEVAEALGVGLRLQVWGDEGRLGSSGDHVTLLRDHLEVATGSTVRSLDPVPVDLSATAQLLDVAGPVVAWGGQVTV